MGMLLPGLLYVYRRKRWDPINYLAWAPINNTDCLRMKRGGSLKCSCPIPSHNVQTGLKWWHSGLRWLRSTTDQQSVFVFVSFVEACSCVIHGVLFVLENFPLAPLLTIQELTSNLPFGWRLLDDSLWSVVSLVENQKSQQSLAMTENFQTFKLSCLQIKLIYSTHKGLV